MAIHRCCISRPSSGSSATYAGRTPGDVANALFYLREGTELAQSITGDIEIESQQPLLHAGTHGCDFNESPPKTHFQQNLNAWQVY